MKDKFFDRKQSLELLEKRIIGLKDGYRQNIAILGDELVGKTSLVFKLLSKFCDNRFLILYIESRHETLQSFGRRFIGILLYNFLLNSNVHLKEDLNFLLEKSASFIPKTVEKARSILKDLEKRKKENIFNRLMSLCDLINLETEKNCVVIIDEFINIENFGVKNIYNEWAQLLIVQKKVMYIIISSQQTKAKNILSKDLSLLFGNFEILILEPFESKNTEDYLDFRLKSAGLNKGIKNFLVHFTGGYPFYLDVITESILNSPQAEVVDILDHLLFTNSGILNQRFSNLIKRFSNTNCSQEYVNILRFISNGQNRIKEITHFLHKNQSDIIPKINFLLETDVITRFGDFLKINDRVFSFWLKFVYQEKQQSLSFDAQNQNSFFKKNLEDMIKDYLYVDNKPVSERIVDLLRMFSDDRLQVEKKNMRLTHFREIKPLEFNHSGIKEGLICRSNDSIWVIGLKNDLVTEEDITDFSKECKKYRNKLERKIIVTMRDLDANSRLMALEEKIWTWDLNHLNHIMDLFSKPRIIA